MPEQDLLDAIVDAQRMITRVGDGVARLQDTLAAGRTGADLPLLADLFALYRDAVACAATARSRRDAQGFQALAAAAERLLTGRGAALVVPTAGDPFDTAAMEAAEIVPTDDPALDRTVAAVLSPGLRLIESGRGVRAARVVVHRSGSQVIGED